MALKTARRGLGRGLAALIPESDFELLNTVARGDIAPSPLIENSLPPTNVSSSSFKLESVTKSKADVTKTVSQSGEVRYLTLDSIAANPFQPREMFSEQELEDLRLSLRG